MQLRVVPKLTFVYDRSVEYGMQLTHLIEAAVAEDAKNAPPLTEEDGAEAEDGGDSADVTPKPTSE
jgi:hypothetical protein